MYRAIARQRWHPHATHSPRNVAGKVAAQLPGAESATTLHPIWELAKSRAPEYIELTSGGPGHPEGFWPEPRSRCEQETPRKRDPNFEKLYIMVRTHGLAFPWESRIRELILSPKPYGLGLSPGKKAGWVARGFELGVRSAGWHADRSGGPRCRMGIGVGAREPRGSELAVARGSELGAAG